ncbi:MAG: isochorismatase family cysteine hydrolase [Candidatus Pacearchaeota archaeon]|nr:isochorismatase family cysteine hydrolase [Candidatus Pacearchaeota archaeon]
MSRTVLVILDLQNCFITDKTKSLPQKIKKYIETQKYDFIIFSKFINSESSNFVKKSNWNKCKNSPETDIVPELSEIALKNHIFEKSAYSIFKSKQFVDFLSQNKISKLYFCGLDLDACILASAFEAFDLGFSFEILCDLSGSSAKINMDNSARQIINRNL